jgi:alcohol dehydrogenase
LIERERCYKPGGVLSNLGVYSGKLSLRLDAFAAGLGDHKIVTTFCPAARSKCGG